MTVGKDKEVTVKSKGAGGQGKVAAKVTGPLGKPVASKVWHIIVIENKTQSHFTRWPYPLFPRVILSLETESQG